MYQQLWHHRSNFNTYFSCLVDLSLFAANLQQWGHKLLFFKSWKSPANPLDEVFPTPSVWKYFCLMRLFHVAQKKAWFLGTNGFFVFKDCRFEHMGNKLISQSILGGIGCVQKMLLHFYKYPAFIFLAHRVSNKEQYLLNLFLPSKKKSTSPSASLTWTVTLHFFYTISLNNDTSLHDNHTFHQLEINHN